MENCHDILIHYAEIALKGKNRPKFIKQLARNVAQALKGTPYYEVRKPSGRLWVTAKHGESFGPEVLERLKRVYGIAWFAPVYKTQMDVDAISELGWKLLEPLKYETFRVTARRSLKNLPLRSNTVNLEVGAYILQRRMCPVKMKGADVELYVEMFPGGAYLYTQKIQGLKGLPVGVTGNVCVMLSGGIDSPVATARMLKRGCKAKFVHFHSQPLVSQASWEKAQDLAELLSIYQGDSILYGVPFGAIQQEIIEKTHGDLRVILYRRLMVRIAAALAQKERCRVLVTGESLAQVASQTLTNLVVIEEASPIPMLRPLIGMDKQEIINEAEKLGSFKISIQPDQDCCSLFVPKHPQTHANIEQVKAEEAKLDIDLLVAQTLERVERIKVTASR